MRFLGVYKCTKEHKTRMIVICANLRNLWMIDLQLKKELMAFADFLCQAE
ncbi:hypothetical protein PITCH_A1710002 [uncultured Desulfobacterium sp.]|uniref:Uncharacterized protein n=1 Tax=uncultured Desulfobacterium sp. TaxID=201089 RepID=A0A445MUP1_9BACT|nr:hypothetical protein PITCH_A1710002 [uncultured Desulfobacterium sp.]